MEWLMGLAGLRNFTALDELFTRTRLTKVFNENKISSLLSTHLTETPTKGGVTDMKSSTQNRMQPGLCALSAGVVVLMLLLPFQAWAVLGGDTSSVHSDVARMKGTLRVHQDESYIVHEIKADTGTVVREYVSPTGTVFAVSWAGAFVPDMQQLLGAYFQQYSAAVKARKASYVGRRPINIHEPGLVVQAGGLMRAYSGRVYIPGLVPEGVKAEDIR
jgi:Protein of unknown function (DUF2844)